MISIGREFGSGGHAIAEELSRRFDLPLYDSNLLEHIAREKNVEQNAYEEYDEQPRNRIFYRTVRGYSNSPQENVANLQFEMLRKMADEGKSFVVTGRCSETVLKEYPALVSVFVLGDIPCKQKRVMEKYGLSSEEALLMMKREDRKRKSYHNYYCKGDWGDSRTYDLTINSSKLGIEGTAEMLESYIRERMGM